jgi:cysteine synthase A
MARRLAREEGLFAGTSSGANVIGAIRAGERLGAGATVVTLLVDSGLKYLSTGLYRREAVIPRSAPARGAQSGCG